MSILQEYRDEEIYFHHSLDRHPDPADYTMHTHDQMELCCFLSGQGIFHVEGNTYPLEEGDILLFGRGEAHYIELDPSVPYERTVLHFNESVLQGVDRDGLLLALFLDRAAGQQNCYHIRDLDQAAVSLLLQKMRSPSPVLRIQVLSLLAPLLLELLPTFHRGISSVPATDPAMSRIIGYINLHLSHHLTLEDICRDNYISKPQLCRLFKKATGSTVSAYITAKRLLRAQEYLSQGMSAGDVAAACGFSEYTTFYRAYRKRYGCAPSGKP